MNDEFQLLYGDEDISVLVPNYLVGSDSDSLEEREDESENIEDTEYSETSGSSSVFSIDDVYNNQITMILSIENLNSNVCIMNDNLIMVNNNLLYLIGVSALLLFFTLVNFVIRIFNNTLGLGRA